jgi:hypothetical protein
MASAKSTLKKVTQPHEAGDVTLTLSGPEARTLFLITNHIAGVPKDSAREYVDNIGRALREAGVRQPWDDNNRHVTGTITLRNDSRVLVEDF